MNNKTNVEEDIKTLEDYSYALVTISSATEKDIRISKAIENMLANREQLQAKANKYDSLVETIKEKAVVEKEEMKHFAKTGDKEEAKIHTYAKEILEELEEEIKYA